LAGDAAYNALDFSKASDAYQRALAHVSAGNQGVQWAALQWDLATLKPRRILSISTEEVVYQSKDTRTKSFVEKRCTPEQFVTLVAQHVQERYRHSMRYFALLAPTVKAGTAATLFALSNSTRRAKPRRQSWAASVQKRFGKDPLKDSQGNRMRWVGSLRAKDV
jgi:hypothetical protein